MAQVQLTTNRLSNARSGPRLLDVVHLPNSWRSVHGDVDWSGGVDFKYSNTAYYSGDTLCRR